MPKVEKKERQRFPPYMYTQARNQDFMWGRGGGGANEAKVDKTTELYFFILSDPFINNAE